MPNQSSITKPVAFRLPVAEYEKIERRAKRAGYNTVGEYLRRKTLYEANRPH